MWKRGTLWVIALGIAAIVCWFLVVVAKTYGLPSSAMTPQTLLPMFGLVLVGVGGADIVRYFINAGIRVKRVHREDHRGSPAVERGARVADKVLATADLTTERPHRTTTLPFSMFIPQTKATVRAGPAGTAIETD